MLLAKFEDAFDDTDLVRSGVQAAEADPIVGEQASTDDITTAIDRTGNQRHLQQRGQFFLLLNRCFRMNDAALIGEQRVAADENAIGNGLPKALDVQCIREDLFGFLVQIGMDESDVIVAGNDIAQRRQTLFAPSEANVVRQRITNVLQFLIRGRRRNEKAMAIAHCQTAHDTAITCERRREMFVDRRATRGTLPIDEWITGM